MLTPGEAPKKPVLSLAYQVRFKPSSRLASNVKREEGRREEGRREEGRREDSSAVHLGGHLAMCRFFLISNLI